MTQTQEHRFDDLGLIPPLCAAVKDEGYTTPTPIQARAIPPVLDGRDLLGLAQTGTGKTAAFALPILQRLAAKKPRHNGHRPVRALVLTPTRELAAQIGESFSTYGRHLPLRNTVIFGGVGIDAQRRALRDGVDILVATPGRLLDLHGQGLIKVPELEVFVLDEADRMLDMGFIHDVRRVIAFLPRKRQTLFFSATMPREAKDLADVLLHDPVTVAVTPPSSTVEKIDQEVLFVDKTDKRALLLDTLRDAGMRRVLVFTRTKHGANRVAEHLTKHGVGAAAHPRQQVAERARAGAGRTSRTARPGSWSRPTSRPAASTSTTSPTSSTSTCPRSPRPTSTASAAPRGPARRASRCRSATSTSASCWSRSSA